MLIHTNDFSRECLKFDLILRKLQSLHNWFTLKTPRHSMGSHELFKIFLEVERLKPDLLFESGVGIGRSTVVFAEIMKPYGKVIAACRGYDEDGLIMMDTSGHENLELINHRGEVVASSLPRKSKVIAVIDGPKPSGYLRGRFEWVELMDRLVEHPNLLAVFQHDIEDLKNMEKFVKYHASNMSRLFRTEFMSKSFMRLHQFYGMEDHSKIFLPNLGMIIRKI